MNPPQSRDLLGLDLSELTELAVSLGEPEYRGHQLFEGLYKEGAPKLDVISPLPQVFRKLLESKGYSAGSVAVDKKFTAADGTIRYLLKMADDQSVEAVWMPEGDNAAGNDFVLADYSRGSPVSDEGGFGNRTAKRRADFQAEKVFGREGRSRATGPRREPQKEFDRATICVSSQAGCAVDCAFCMTALLGLNRNLTAGEIVGQILAVLADRQVVPRRERINIVFMGMGEPFLNYDNFMKAIHLLVKGVGIPEARMTVSTAGIVPRIYDLGGETIRPRLAISLNAPDDPIRSSIMPINRKWNLAALIDAARAFPLRNREYLFFEYVLLDGVNDRLEHARKLAELIRGIRCKVNLIAFNAGPGVDFKTPDESRVHHFQQVLIAAGFPTYVRRPRGREIYAACGQLKRTVA